MLTLKLLLRWIFVRLLELTALSTTALALVDQNNNLYTVSEFIKIVTLFVIWFTITGYYILTFACSILFVISKSLKFLFVGEIISIFVSFAVLVALLNFQIGYIFYIMFFEVVTISFLNNFLFAKLFRIQEMR